LITDPADGVSICAVNIRLIFFGNSFDAVNATAPTNSTTSPPPRQCCRTTRGSVTIISRNNDRAIR